MQNNLDNGASLLIDVPLPLGGAINIGKQSIVYYNGFVFKAILIRLVYFYFSRHLFVRLYLKAYGRVDSDGSRYLLSNHNGMLYLLFISYDKERLVLFCL